jgi:hypothetical protein
VVTTSADNREMFRNVSRDQFAMTWSLLTLYLDPLTDEDCLWQPTTPCWSVTEVDGRYMPDWTDAEPSPAPLPSIAWLTWHIGWWWQSTIDSLAGLAPSAPMQTPWAGSAAEVRSQLYRLHANWLEFLDTVTEEQLREMAPYPWRDVPTRFVAHTVAWVNAELMKNTAEIGELYRLRALRTSSYVPLP